MASDSQLLTAILLGQVNEARALLRSGNCNVNSRDSTGDTPLHYACQCGEPKHG